MHACSDHAMAAAAATTTTTEIVRLNVSGRQFATRRATLLRGGDDSFFARLLQGHFPLPLDDTGAIFVDRNPEYFAAVLDLLQRAGTVVGTPCPPGLDPARLREELDFYGLATGDAAPRALAGDAELHAMVCAAREESLVAAMAAHGQVLRDMATAVQGGLHELAAQTPADGHDYLEVVLLPPKDRLFKDPTGRTCPVQPGAHIVYCYLLPQHLELLRSVAASYLAQEVGLTVDVALALAEYRALEKMWLGVRRPTEPREALMQLPSSEAWCNRGVVLHSACFQHAKGLSFRWHFAQRACSP